MYDYIIIGAGVSGLYTAEKLIDRSPNLHICILEKDDHVGGRAYNVDFHGVSVETGAGVGRWPHDKKLRKWLEKHGANVTIEPCNLRYYIPGKGLFMEPPLNVHQEANSNIPFPTKKERSMYNFKEWLDLTKGKEYRKEFVFSASYDDYLKMDTVDALENYHFQDLDPHTQIFTVQWTAHENRVKKYLEDKGVIIKLNHPVVKISTKEDGSHYHVEVKKKTYIETFHGKKVIIALPANPAYTLLKKSGYTKNAELIKNNIKYQYFIRAYVKFKGPKNYIEANIGDEIVCGTPFRKIIPMNPKKRVYMIAYCDNIHTNYWKKLKSIPELERDLSDLFNDTIHIEDFECFFRPEATHYYLPLPMKYSSREEFIEEVIHVDKNITLIGECVSLNQFGSN